MCIRDRVRWLEGTSGRHGIRADGCSGYVRNDADDFIIGGAVSYTHLRAHETVLDLVCRLLLEKKKTRTIDEGNQLVL